MMVKLTRNEIDEELEQGGEGITARIKKMKDVIEQDRAETSFDSDFGYEDSNEKNDAYNRKQAQFHNEQEKDGTYTLYCEDAAVLKGLDKPAEVSVSRDRLHSEFEGISVINPDMRIIINHQRFLEIEKQNGKTQFYKVDKKGTKRLAEDVNLCTQVTLINSINPEDKFTSLRIIQGDNSGGKFIKKFGENSGFIHTYNSVGDTEIVQDTLYVKHNGEYLTAQASRDKDIYEAFYVKVKEKGVKVSELPEELRDTLMEKLPLPRIQHAQEQLDAMKSKKTNTNQTTEQKIATYEKSREKRASTTLNKAVETKINKEIMGEKTKSII